MEPPHVVYNEKMKKAIFKLTGCGEELSNEDILFKEGLEILYDQLESAETFDGKKVANKMRAFLKRHTQSPDQIYKLLALKRDDLLRELPPFHAKSSKDTLILSTESRIILKDFVPYTPTDGYMDINLSGSESKFANKGLYMSRTKFFCLERVKIDTEDQGEVHLLLCYDCNLIVSIDKQFTCENPMLDCYNQVVHLEGIRIKSKKGGSLLSAYDIRNTYCCYELEAEDTLLQALIKQADLSSIKIDGRADIWKTPDELLDKAKLLQTSKIHTHSTPMSSPNIRAGSIPNVETSTRGKATGPSTIKSPSITTPIEKPYHTLKGVAEKTIAKPKILPKGKGLQRDIYQESSPLKSHPIERKYSDMPGSDMDTLSAKIEPPPWSEEYKKDRLSKPAAAEVIIPPSTITTPTGKLLEYPPKKIYDTAQLKREYPTAKQDYQLQNVAGSSKGKLITSSATASRMEISLGPTDAIIDDSEKIVLSHPESASTIDLIHSAFAQLGKVKAHEGDPSSPHMPTASNDDLPSVEPKEPNEEEGFTEEGPKEKSKRKRTKKKSKKKPNAPPQTAPTIPPNDIESIKIKVNELMAAKENAKSGLGYSLILSTLPTILEMIDYSQELSTFAEEKLGDIQKLENELKELDTACCWRKSRGGNRNRDQESE